MSPLAQGKPKPPPTKFVWTVRKKFTGYRSVGVYYTTTKAAWGESGSHGTRCPCCREILHYKHFDLQESNIFYYMKPGETRSNPCPNCSAYLVLLA